MPVFIIPLLMALISNLPSLIQAAENAFSGKPGNGAAKKDLVMQGVGTAIDVWKTLAQQPLPDEHVRVIMDAASSLTDTTVKVYNAFEIFKKGG